MVRIAVVGDVHGHLAQLKEMVAKIEARRVDRVILLGDLIDRGPESEGCLEFARTHRFKTRSGHLRALEVVCGNHEDGFVRALLKMPKPGHTTPMAPTDARLAARIKPETVRWLSGLPYVIRIEALDLTLVHGGILPAMRKWADLDERVMRTRFLTAQGTADSGLSGDRARFWAASYDGRFGTVVFGHDSAAEPRFFEHALGLDGEGFRKLHAAVFTNERSGLKVTTLTVNYPSLPPVLPRLPVASGGVSAGRTPRESTDSLWDRYLGRAATGAAW